MIKCSISIALSAIFLSLNTHVFAESAKPVKCPSSDAIQASGLLSIIRAEEPMKYAALNHSHYDTNDDWGFLIGLFKASSSEEALKKANDALHHLSGNPSPERYDDKVWICYYHVGQSNLIAAAFTPALMGNVSNVINSI